MEPFWALLRPSWAPWRRLGTVLDQSWTMLGVKDAILEPSGAKNSTRQAAGGTGRSPRGSSFGKEPKPTAKGFSTPGTPVMNQQGAADDGKRA